MTCPLCGSRRARRSCPALDKQICAVCCATKRLVEIACPADCAYLATAREHPSAAALRRQQHDVALLVQAVRDLNERQSRLFFLVAAFLVRHQAPELLPVIDDDVVQASAAMAATSETAAHGVIYEHHPASPQAGRLAATLKPLLEQAGQGAGTSFDRDATVVLRRIEEAARQAGAIDPGNQRAFLDLLVRILPKGEESESPTDRGEPRLIVP